MIRALGLIASALWSCGLCQVHADETPTLEQARLAFRFEPHSSRLAQGQLAQCDRLATLLQDSPSARPILLLPSEGLRARARFLAARSAELAAHCHLDGLGMRARRDPTIAAEDELLYVAIIAPMPSPTILAPAETAPATPDGMGWSARSGRTLHALLTEWSARAGWTLIWRSAYDYPLEASANFPGDFAQAATMLVSGFAEASPPPRAKLFRDNRVLVIE